MRSKASLRVCSQSLLKSEMLPPTMVCKLAPMVPTMERERTTIPRTTPRLRFTRKPGSSNAVVTYSCGTMVASRAPVNFDGRRTFHYEALLQAVTPVANNRGRDGIAAHRHRPLLPQEEFGP